MKSVRWFILSVLLVSVYFLAESGKTANSQATTPAATAATTAAATLGATATAWFIDRFAAS